MPEITNDILSALRAMHPSNKGWVFLGELRTGTAYGTYDRQYMDAWAINCWPSHGKHKAPHLRRAFEVKASASDLLRELRDPDKRWMAYAVSHEFYFVAPKGLIKKSLLDKNDGLIEWENGSLKIVKPPRVREAMPPQWSFVASLLRHRLGMEEARKARLREATTRLFVPGGDACDCIGERME